MASMLKMYLPYIDYCINYKYISTVLCENKDKPEMQCHGKCHLEKTIKKAEEEDTKEKTTPASVKVITFQEIPSQQLNFVFNKLNLSTQNTTIAQYYLSPVLDIVAPPPQKTA
jgi:hypothetical protein